MCWERMICQEFGIETLLTASQVLGRCQAGILTRKIDIPQIILLFSCYISGSSFMSEGSSVFLPPPVIISLLLTHETQTHLSEQCGRQSRSREGIFLQGVTSDI